MAGPDESGWSGMGTAWSIIGTLAAGILVWGGVGFLLDRWLDLRWLFLPIGMVVGVGTAIYMVYVRYDKDA